MEWWGPTWGAPINYDCPERIPPVGEPCTRCEEPIRDGDSGLSLPILGTFDDAHYHITCFLRAVGVGLPPPP